MRILGLSYVKSGMLLGRTIFDGKDNILLRDHTVLSDEYIRKLRKRGVPYCYILDHETEDIQIDDVVSEEVRQEGITLVRNIFKTGVINYEEISQTTDKIIEELLNNKEISLQVIDIKTYDNYTFAHSVNTCVLGVCLAKKMRIPGHEMRKLAVGLLLHDIGKLLVPESIVNKPGKLTDEEFKVMKKHSQYGWELLRKNNTISPLSRIVALQHHEKYNGTGYPDNLKSDKIHIFGQIAAIADVYDAMTSDRIYRKRHYPHQVLEYFMGNGNIHFNFNLVSEFLQIIPPFSVGTTVKLSTGDEAVIKSVNMQWAMRPSVRILNSHGTLEDIDLIDHPNITVIEVY